MRIENEKSNEPLDLESELIDHLHVHDDLLYIIKDGVTGTLIYNPTNKAVFQFAVHHYNETNKAPTLAVLSSEFPGRTFGDTDTAVEWVVAKLKSRYQKNEVQETVRELAKRIEDPADAMRYMQERSLEIERNTVSQQSIWTPADYPVFLREIQQDIISGSAKGFSYGYDAIDLFTGGQRKGQLCGLAARPKRQKTFNMLKSFIAQAMAGEKPILHTLELTPKEIMLRVSCMISGYPWDMAYRLDFPNKKDWEILNQAWSDFNANYDFVIARPPVDERTVPSLFLLADKLDCTSVMISQFKYIQPTKERYRDSWEKWGDIVVDLKLAATRAGQERPVYVETQLNREAQNMTEMMDADLAQLGLTDMWGQAADIVFCLFQNKEMREGQQVELGIIESRNTDKRSWFIEYEYRDRTSLDILR